METQHSLHLGTLILGARDIEALLDRDGLFRKVRAAFGALTKAVWPAQAWRYPIDLPAEDPDANAMLIAPGLIPGIPAYTVKANAKFPTQRPAIRGIVALNSLKDGRVLAILHSGALTTARTAASGAIGTDILARRDASSIAIIGCGVQGRAQLQWISRVRQLKQALFYDIDRGQSDALARLARDELQLEAKVCDSAASAARLADIVVTATWAREPFLSACDVRPGTHITALGADGPHECELSADLLEKAIFFANDSRLQVEMGAIAGAGLGGEAITAEIGEVLAGLKAGRSCEDDVTVYGMVGLPFQDLAAAWLVYEAAIAQGIGVEVDLMDG